MNNSRDKRVDLALLRSLLKYHLFSAAEKPGGPSLDERRTLLLRQGVDIDGARKILEKRLGPPQVGITRGSGVIVPISAPTPQSENNEALRAWKFLVGAKSYSLRPIDEKLSLFEIQELRQRELHSLYKSGVLQDEVSQFEITLSDNRILTVPIGAFTDARAQMPNNSPGVSLGARDKKRHETKHVPFLLYYLALQDGRLELLAGENAAVLVRLVGG